MDGNGLFKQIIAKKSFLCVGLDTDITKIPKHLQKEKDPVFEFNKQIIDATNDLCIAYKFNMGFYEALGEKGWVSLQKTLEYIPKGIFKIADGKWGDIGNTTEQYAKAYFETLKFDAVTLSPYMGKDAIAPFLEHKNKWAIVLALTSNEGSQDFQFLKNGPKYFFERVAEKIVEWGTPENTMLVVGGTHPDEIAKIRDIAPDHFFLVPGLGAQGGELSKIMKNGLNKKNCGLIVNAGRSIIYAGSGKDFKVKAMKAAFQYQREMEFELKANKLLK